MSSYEQNQKDRQEQIGTITLFSHGIRVKTKDDRVATACRRALSDWSVVTEEKEYKKDGSYTLTKKETHLYGTAFDQKKEYWFHKGQLTGLQKEIAAYGLVLDDFLIHREPTKPARKFKLSLKEGRVLRPHQVDAKAFAIEPVHENDFFAKLIAMPVGTGKSLDNRTPVQTPTGWVPIGKLKVGDEVIACDGTATKVTGVYPQGILPTFSVTFEDGRKVRASEDHLWSITCLGDTVVRTTGEIRELLKESPVSIPLATPYRKDAVHLHYDPYLEGIRCARSHTDERNASIDAQFLEGSPEQRQDLLNGILDATGDRIDETGKFRIELLSEVLAAQVQGIIRSLGGKAKLSYRKTNEGVTWVLKGELQPLYVNKGSLALTSIVPSEDAYCTCISVDHPDKLFVVNDFIVTHNTVTLCGIIAEVGERTMIGILPRYSKKWGGDLLENLDVDPKKIMMIEKTSQLRGVIDLCIRGGAKTLPPLLIITLTTMRAFIESFEEDPENCKEDYGCVPTELWGLLEIGIFAIDEAHQHLYSVFKASLYLHGPKFIALSGTMRTEDDFEEKVQNVIFPKIKRFLNVKMEKYIDLEFIEYNFIPAILPKMRYQVFGRPDYSHTALEASIIRHPPVLRDYIHMTEDLLYHGYINRREPGEKAGIYVGTVEMATKFVEFLTLRHPKLNVVRYCAGAGDKYEDLMACDVYVSTIQSAGTALDIARLICVICTTMVSSSKTNIQVLGRLRKLPNGREVIMFMPYCRQIPKHHKYTNFRREIFKDITRSIRTFNFDRYLGAGR